MRSGFKYWKMTKKYDIDNMSKVRNQSALMKLSIEVPGKQVVWQDNNSNAIVAEMQKRVLAERMRTYGKKAKLHAGIQQV